MPEDGGSVTFCGTIFRKNTTEGRGECGLGRRHGCWLGISSLTGAPCSPGPLPEQVSPVRAEPLWRVVFLEVGDCAVVPEPRVSNQPGAEEDRAIGLMMSAMGYLKSGYFD